MTLEEQFEQLSDNGKAYLGAMVVFEEMTQPRAVASPELFTLTRTLEDLRAAMSESEGQAVSDYAHRRDFPLMYSEEGKALELND